MRAAGRSPLRSSFWKRCTRAGWCCSSHSARPTGSAATCIRRTARETWNRRWCFMPGMDAIMRRTSRPFVREWAGPSGELLIDGDFLGDPGSLAETGHRDFDVELGGVETARRFADPARVVGIRLETLQRGPDGFRVIGTEGHSPSAREDRLGEQSGVGDNGHTGRKRSDERAAGGARAVRIKLQECVASFQMWADFWGVDVPGCADPVAELREPADKGLQELFSRTDQANFKGRILQKGRESVHQKAGNLRLEVGKCANTEMCVAPAKRFYAMTSLERDVAENPQQLRLRFGSQFLQRLLVVFDRSVGSAGAAEHDPGHAAVDRRQEVMLERLALPERIGHFMEHHPDALAPTGQPATKRNVHRLPAVHVRDILHQHRLLAGIGCQSALERHQPPQTELARKRMQVHALRHFHLSGRRRRPNVYFAIPGSETFSESKSVVAYTSALRRKLASDDMPKHRLFKLPSLARHSIPKPPAASPTCLAEDIMAGRFSDRPIGSRFWKLVPRVLRV